MESARLNALKRKQEIEDSIRVLREELAEISRFFELLDKYGGTEGESVDSASTPIDSTANRVVEFKSTPPAYRDIPRRGNPNIIAGMVEDILKERRRPMTRGELARLIQEKGGVLQGADDVAKAKYVGTILWRQRDRFENIEGRGYWMKDIPVPIERMRLAPDERKGD